MNRFFSCLVQLHQFTLNLSFHSQGTQCSKCLKFNQFTSHGYFYKNKSQGQPLTCGKRIFCSNRNGRSGCGATFRLYLSHTIPNFTVSASVISIFILALFQGFSIQNAYFKATKREEPRQAYRWIKRIQLAQILFRQNLSNQQSTNNRSNNTINPLVYFNIDKIGNLRLRNFLEPLASYFSIHIQNTCCEYQTHFQCSFF